MATTTITTTVATGSRLVGVSEVKTHLGVSGSADDTVIGSMVDAAQQAMEGYAGRHLVSTARTETIDGTGKRRLWLAEPAESITSVHVDSDQSWTAASLVDADDYELDGCAVDYRYRVWTRGNRNVRVIYQAGYATVPDDLVRAVTKQVALYYAEWQRTKEGADNLASETQEGWSRKWIQQVDLGEEVRRVLDRYVPERL